MDKDLYNKSDRFGIQPVVGHFY